MDLSRRVNWNAFDYIEVFHECVPEVLSTAPMHYELIDTRKPMRHEFYDRWSWAAVYAQSSLEQYQFQVAVFNELHDRCTVATYAFEDEPLRCYINVTCYMDTKKWGVFVYCDQYWWDITKRYKLERRLQHVHYSDYEWWRRRAAVLARARRRHAL